MNIELQGLSAKEMAFCDVMWALETQESVTRFIATLPPQDQLTCQSLIELMQLAFLDEVDSVDQASSTLERFML
jgi:hypothetical protein